MTCTAIQNGHVASIVTTMEMKQRPAPRPVPQSEMRLERWEAPPLEKYRMLFRRVGEPWLWFSRLIITDEELAAIIHDPQLMIWAVTDRRGKEVGILELDFRKAKNCEITFFGLIPSLNGQGHGRWLMAMALQLGWAHAGVERMWLHTCTLDGPSALGFYRKSGFVPYERELETYVDPRLSGHLPMDAAPQIPVIGKSALNECIEN